ncbi:hypothetical protein HDU98_006187 [Podochytrium sp. JEL0797]|nr:hypothetical protein HDU98_006187 [Podochytrium sp. JEL0797]
MIGSYPNRDDEDGGDVVEEIEPAASKEREPEPKPFVTGWSNRATESGRKPRVGGVISDTISKFTWNGGRKTASKPLDLVVVPEPPKSKHLPNQEPVKKLTEQEKEEEERIPDVVGFLTSTKSLPSRFIDHYKLGELLGQGAFGFVMTATDVKNGREMMPKRFWVNNPGTPSEPVRVEIAVLQQINHPNIIQYIEHIMEHAKYVLLVMELNGTEWTSSHVLAKAAEPLEASPSSPTPANARASTAKETSTVPVPPVASLANRTCIVRALIKLNEGLLAIYALKRFPEFRAQQVCAQIALVIKYLQDFTETSKTKILSLTIEFGSVAQIPTRVEDYFTTFNGTTFYASPEFFAASWSRIGNVVMSLGVLLFTMVFGERPFQSIREIRRAEYRMPFGLESDSEYEGCRHLINRLLTYNVKERITIDEVLKHTWLRGEVRRYQKLYNAAP